MAWLRPSPIVLAFAVAVLSQDLRNDFELLNNLNGLTNLNGLGNLNGLNGMNGLVDYDNEGTCPKIANGDAECPPPSQIENTCLVDTDCDSGEKCCTDGCSLGCMKANRTIEKAECTVPVELGFLIDASGSIGAENFLKILNFVAKIIDAFEVSENGTHVGVISYSKNATVDFDFNHFQGKEMTKKNIIDKINTISVTEGQTRIDLALQAAYEQLFSKKGGMRSDKPKIILVLTDGRQTKGPDAPDAIDLHVASRPLKDLGVQVYSLGIGKNYDIGELLDIASDDASVFRSADVDELIGIVASITEQTCKGCTNAVDIHFAIDASANVGPENFAMIQNFVKAVGYKFILSETGSHMSASVFGEDAQLAFNMSKAVHQDEFLDEVDMIPYLGDQASNIDKVLRLAAEKVFTLGGFTRQKAPKVLVLITASNCMECEEPLDQAVELLKLHGVHVITIPIGNNVNMQELEALSSYPSKDFVLPQNSFTELLNGVFIQKVSKMICSGKPGICKQTARPETCPPLIQYNCEVDVDCPDAEKCCLSGCDKSCGNPVTACITPIDMAFAFDNTRGDVSQSDAEETFEKMKSFASGLIDHFAVGEAGTHISLSYFGKQPTMLTSFGDSYSKHTLKKEIRDMALSQESKADLASMMQFARRNVFNLEGRARQALPRALVVFTHGSYSNEFRIRDEARKLKKVGEDVQVMVVHVGEERQELMKDVVSQPQARRLIKVSSSQDLSTHEQRVAIAEEVCSVKARRKSCADQFSPICSVRDNLCQTDFDCPGFQECAFDGCRKKCLFCGDRCNDKMDLLLILDDSKRIGAEGFEKTKDFLNTLLEWFDIHDNGTHVAAMTYSDSARAQFNFPRRGSSNNVVQTLESMQKLVGSIKYTGGSRSRLDKALELAAAQYFPRQLSERRKAKRAIILVTDGNTDASSKRLDLASWPLRGQTRTIGNETFNAITVMAVSIGKQVNTDGLSHVVTPPAHENVFLAANYDDLYNSVRELAQESCEFKSALAPKPVEAIPGDPGPPGPKGFAGTDGTVGPPGEDGRPGDQGRVGPKGPPGADGDEGYQGPPGPSGGGAGGVGDLKGPDVGAIEVLGRPVRGRNGVVFDLREGPDGPPGPAGSVGKPGVSGSVGVVGQVGLPGPVGPQGPFGSQGDKGLSGKDGEGGPAGDAGPQGQAGEQGPTGSIGLPGLQGTHGYKGDQGQGGPLGDSGEAGKPGERGYGGEKGEQGAVGLIGSTGKVGPTGPVGSTGQRGLRGPDGKRGGSGITGADGAKGQPGPRGPAGAKGQTGQPGTRGLKGATGDPGATGEQGYPGPIGTTGDPGSDGAGGSPGDAGPAGVDGASGPAGQRGDIGKPGEQGPQGPLGKKGDVGMTGSRGMTGEKGETGPAGPLGAQGNTGSQGKQGNTGPVGSRGSRGPQGSQGLQGQTGDPGQGGRSGGKGAQGLAGDGGPAGGKGARGLPGATGPKGQIGDMGSAGRPGYAGRDGKTGPQGANGKDGDQGPGGPRGMSGLPGDVGGPGIIGDRGLSGGRGAGGAEGAKGIRGDAGGRGLPGLAGPGGAPGARGEPGAQGETGSIGAQGPQGVRGAPGLTGQEGTQGSKGISGSRGSPGKGGEQGASGAPGLPGAAGQAGAIGDNGDAGPDGMLGEQGLSGPAGRRGLPGREGFPGAMGTRGFVGAKGKAGSQGLKGAAGQDGPAGARGSVGLPGPLGVQGSRGSPGKEGNAGLDGNTGSRGEQGKPGKPGTQGRVGLPGIRGPTGPPGLVGVKGPSGDRGDTGEAGPIGVTGEVGKVGALGAIGDRGLIGQIGVNGEVGPQGTPGPQGAPGQVGPSGPSGSSGAPGKFGVKGPTGDVGNSGNAGRPGEQGSSGKDGTPGKDGTNGKVGAIGPDGPGGPQGSPGPQGPRGRPGRGGFRGITGVKGFAGRNGFNGLGGKRGSTGKEGAQGPSGPVGGAGKAGKAGADGTPAIAGRVGDQGDAGDRGDTGKQGPTGDGGDQGRQGPGGDTGLLGERGANGRSGAPGARGLRGDGGAIGPAGKSGATGVTGLKGFKGKMGRYGARGDQGPKGSNGDNGYPGQDGYAGPQGPNGEHGPDGVTGKTGDSGTTGNPGQVGDEGELGIPGDSGRPGSAGNSGPPGPPGPPGDTSGVMSAGFWEFMGASGALKGPGYYRKRRSVEEPDTANDVINKNYDTFREFYDVIQRHDNLVRGTGERSVPARTCKDLFSWIQDKPSGDYWIDPNEGSPYDAFLVYCNKTSLETCIYPQTTVLDLEKHVKTKDQYIWAFKDILDEPEGMKYATNIYQMKVMKALSAQARQNVTYHCRNSRAHIKLMGDMEDYDEADARGKPVLRPQILIDDCKLKDAEQRRSVFEIITDKMDQLPLQDVAAYDVGDDGEEFGLEIGPICFS